MQWQTYSSPDATGRRRLAPLGMGRTATAAKNSFIVEPKIPDNQPVLLTLVAEKKNFCSLRGGPTSQFQKLVRIHVPRVFYKLMHLLRRQELLLGILASCTRQPQLERMEWLTILAMESTIGTRSTIYAKGEDP